MPTSRALWALYSAPSRYLSISVICSRPFLRREHGASLSHRRLIGAQSVMGTACALLGRLSIAALQDFDPPYVRFGSKAEKLELSSRCPLYPRKRISSNTPGMSALCQ